MNRLKIENLESRRLLAGGVPGTVVAPEQPSGAPIAPIIGFAWWGAEESGLMGSSSSQPTTSAGNRIDEVFRSTDGAGDTELGQPSQAIAALVVSLRDSSHPNSGTNHRVR